MTTTEVQQERRPEEEIAQLAVAIQNIEAGQMPAQQQEEVELENVMPRRSSSSPPHFRNVRKRSTGSTSPGSDSATPRPRASLPPPAERAPAPRASLPPPPRPSTSAWQQRFASTERSYSAAKVQDLPIDVDLLEPDSPRQSLTSFFMNLF